MLPTEAPSQEGTPRMSTAERPAKPPAMWRCGLALLLGAMVGQSGRRALYRVLLNYRIDRAARIGVAFVRVGMLELKAGARIGNLTVIRNVDLVALGENARIGTFNWIYGFPGQSAKHFTAEVDRRSELVLERESALTSRHIVDCTDRVTIKEFATVAGFMTQIITHGIDIAANRQSAAPVTIGRYAMVGTRSILTKGAALPDFSILGAGSVLRDAPTTSYALYSGVPAVFVRALDATTPHFNRSEGRVA